MITTREYEDLEEPISRIKAYSVKGVVKATSCKEKYVLEPEDKLSLYAGLRFWTWRRKKDLAHSLVERGCEVTVYPVDPAEILAVLPMALCCKKKSTEIPRKIQRLSGKSGSCMSPIHQFQCAWSSASWRWQQEQTPSN